MFFSFWIRVVMVVCGRFRLLVVCVKLLVFIIVVKICMVWKWFIVFFFEVVVRENVGVVIGGKIDLCKIRYCFWCVILL